MNTAIKDIKLSGSFYCQIRDKKTGIILKELPWQNNLLLNNWFRHFSGEGHASHPFGGASAYRPILCLGEGAVTEPTIDDTDLTNQTVSAATSSDTWDVFVTNDVSNGYFTNSRAMYFIINTNRTRTFTEGGLRVGTSTGTLVTRFLFDDPVTIEDWQSLYLVYRFQNKTKYDAPLYSTTMNVPEMGSAPIFIGVSPEALDIYGPPSSVDINLKNYGFAYGYSGTLSGLDAYDALQLSRTNSTRLNKWIGPNSINRTSDSVSYTFSLSALTTSSYLSYYGDFNTNEQKTKKGLIGLIQYSGYQTGAINSRHLCIYTNYEGTIPIPANYSIDFNIECSFGRG